MLLFASTKTPETPNSALVSFPAAAGKTLGGEALLTGLRFLSRLPNFPLNVGYTRRGIPTNTCWIVSRRSADASVSCCPKVAARWGFCASMNVAGTRWVRAIIDDRSCFFWRGTISDDRPPGKSYPVGALFGIHESGA